MIVYLLTNDIHGYIYMTYESRHRSPESPAPERRPHAAPGGRDLARGRGAFGPGLCHLPPASLSVPPAGGAADRPGPGRRSQAGIYDQTPSQPDSPRAAVRHRHGRLAQRGGQPSAPRSAPTGAPAWGEGPRRQPPVVQLEYQFDRLLPDKLAHVYEVLVPDHRWPLGGTLPAPASPARELSDEHPGRDLRARVLGPTAGTTRLPARRRHWRSSPPPMGSPYLEDWVFEDAGYSGASLVRPGLERIRDLAAEGHIQAVLVHAPDRLSRKYAYQVLLTEEFSRHGVETVFLKAPSSATPEDQLLVQFQGMIAEYERAQILERSRRGKRHRAKAGEVAVLGTAPYGYRYVKKTDTAPARFEIIPAEADGGAPDLRAIHRGGVVHRRHRPSAQRPGGANPPPGAALGALDGVGPAAQSRLPGYRLLRQDADGAAPTGDPAAAR